MNIDHLDFSGIKKYLQKTKKWSARKISRAENNYRKFLQKHVDKPSGSFAPSPDVDIFWHLHILDTTQYLTDCMLTCGRIIHHIPSYSKHYKKPSANQHLLKKGFGSGGDCTSGGDKTDGDCDSQ